MSAVAALARRAIRFELRIWRSLFRWLLRRPTVSGPGARAFSHAGGPTPVILAFIVVSAIEIPAVHLLLPWRTAQIVALVLGCQALLWMVGYLASLRTSPHVVSDTGLRLRTGTGVDVAIGWETVDTVRARTRTLPSNRTVQYTGTVLSLVVLSQTTVDVVFREPIRVGLPDRDVEPVTEMRFYADDPAGLVAAANRADRSQKR